MKKLCLAVAILGLAVVASARPTYADPKPPTCYGILQVPPPYGTCGFTGELCNAGTGCLYDCENGLWCWAP